MSQRNFSRPLEHKKCELEKLLREMFRSNKDTKYSMSMITQKIIDGEEFFYAISPNVNDETIKLVLSQLVDEKAIIEFQKNDRGDYGYQWNPSRSNPFRQ